MRTFDEPRNPRLALLADHAQISALIERLLMRVRANEETEALRVWQGLEPALLAHLDAEEAYVLPALDDTEHAECGRIRDEHAQIRRTVGELGMALELHTARAEPIVAFCAFLGAHAEREDSLLYPSAERHMPVVVARSLVSRLRAIGVGSKRPSRGGGDHPAGPAKPSRR